MGNSDAQTRVTLHKHIQVFLSIGLFVSAGIVSAQQIDSEVLSDESRPSNKEEDVAELGIVVTTGTRVEGRTPTESVSPIDIYSGRDLVRQSSADLTDQLRNISPSFNAQRFPIADGGSFVRAAGLRNLPPDQTLVLVNGRRRHRSALVHIQSDPGTVNQGSQGVDFGLIPAEAIERIEILRDGSSAQYGSDAIAGVVNIILKDRSEGISFTSQYGSTYDGDGDNYRFATNIGLPLGPTGFFNATAEYFNFDPTSRGTARPDALQVGQVLGIDQIPFDGLGQRWGSPNSDGFRLFFNAEIPTGESISIYGHGSYADQESDTSFLYRAPVGIDGVQPRATLFVDDDGDGFADPVSQSIIDDILDAGLNPADFVTPDPNSPTGFIAINPIASLFPAGYTPTFGADMTDFEGVLGVRGELNNGLRWDLSGRFGENEINYIIENTINPSLGINSPIRFEPGVLEQRETGINADFVYPIHLPGLSSALNIAFGAEYRRETYEIGIGDTASFEVGPTSALFGVGSDGFQGDRPESAGEFKRDSYAGYIDLETDLNDWLTLAAAGRFEDLEGFDSNFDWKVSARAQVLDNLALRATVNTGFRAPTPGQINTTDVTTSSDLEGNLIPLGTFGINTPAAQALGAQPLETEESFNVSVGLVFEPLDNFTLTVDYYNIDIDDRIVLNTTLIEPGSPERQALIDAGVSGGNLIGSASFFLNGFDSTVQGVDVVANAQFDLGGAGYLITDARHSYNDQDVDRFVEGTIDPARIFDLENQLPNHRSVLTLDYRTPWNLDVLVRGSRYGEWQDASFGEISEFSSEWLFDLVVTYHFDRFRITAGAENIFDNFPDDDTNSVLRFLGARRPVGSPFGFEGGTWFMRASFDVL